MTLPENHDAASRGESALERGVRPRAWLCVATDGAELLTRHEDDVIVARAMNKGCQVLGLYAMPPEAAEYLLHVLRQERSRLDGFVSIGNERPRAQRLDAWIAAISGA